MPTINVRKFSRSKIPEPEISYNNGNAKLETIVEESKEDDHFDIGNTDDYIPIPDNSNDDFLADLGNDKFVSQSVIEKSEKEKAKEEKQQEKENKQLERQQKLAEKSYKDAEKYNNKAVKQAKVQKQEEEDALFSEKGSELYGRDRLQLIAKIQQYKILFPENKQLKLLKIKRNVSVEELQSYVAECEAIIDTDVVESFITDSILSTLKMAEYASVRTRFNIKGLSDMLKNNPQFNSLCKQLYIKYKVFAKIPPEMQMLLLVTTSAYVCVEKNRLDLQKEAVLQKQIDPNIFNL